MNKLIRFNQKEKTFKQAGRIMLANCFMHALVTIAFVNVRCELQWEMNNTLLTVCKMTDKYIEDCLITVNRCLTINNIKNQNFNGIDLNTWKEVFERELTYRDLTQYKKEALEDLVTIDEALAKL